jgi:tetrahydromethanopterin S-methyltransferase subunit G
MSDKPSKPNDPIFLDLVQRVARLEEKSIGLERSVNALSDRIGSIEGKMWWIIAGIVVSILLQILWRLIP